MIKLGRVPPEATSNSPTLRLFQKKKKHALWSQSELTIKIPFHCSYSERRHLPPNIALNSLSDLRNNSASQGAGEVPAAWDEAEPVPAPMHVNRRVKHSTCLPGLQFSCIATVKAEATKLIVGRYLSGQVVGSTVSR